MKRKFNKLALFYDFRSKQRRTSEKGDAPFLFYIRFIDRSTP